MFRRQWHKGVCWLVREAWVFQGHGGLLQIQVSISPSMSGLGQLLSSGFVQFIGLAAVVIDRPQVAQRSVEPLAVVPADDLRQDVLGLLSVG